MDILYKPVPSIHGERIAGRAATVRQQIRGLAGEIDKNSFDLGELFLEVQVNSYAKQWGYDNLGEYALLELGIKPRRAQYLARITRVCKAAGVARKDYEKVGTTKLREIATLDPKGSYFNQDTRQNEPLVEHIANLIAEAPDMTTEEVEQEIRRLKGMVGDNAMQTRSFILTVSGWRDVVDRAFEQVRRMKGSKSRDVEGKAIEYSNAQCLEDLCADWLADPHNFMEEPDQSKIQLDVPMEGI